MTEQNWQHYGVRAVKETGPAPVKVGDPLYLHGDSLVLDADSRGTLAGTADEEMYPGEPRVIRVNPIPAPIEEKSVKGGKDAKSV